jgi:hypothetical protein
MPRRMRARLAGHRHQALADMIELLEDLARRAP